MNDTHYYISSARQELKNIPEENIPEALKLHDNWCVWRYEKEGGRLTKIPYTTISGKKAKSNDPKTWTSFEEALKFYHNPNRRMNGIGFFLGKTGITAGDLDYKGENIDDVANEWINTIDSYCEISPSGKGLRFFAYGKLPQTNNGAVKYKSDNCELYDSSTNRFMTVTGNRVGSQTEVQQRDEQITLIHSKYIDIEAEKAPRNTGVTFSRGSVNSESIESEKKPLSRKLELVQYWLTDQTGTIAGSNASDKCYAIACELIHGFDLKPEEAIGIFVEWGQQPSNQNEHGVYYPWTYKELMHKLKSAYSKTPNQQVGSKLNEMKDIITGGDYQKIEEMISTISTVEAEGTFTTTSSLDLNKDYYDKIIQSDPMIDSFVTKEEAKKAENSSFPKIRFYQIDEKLRRAKENPIEWILDGWLLKRGLHMLAASSFAGKSVLMSELGSAIANGLPFANIPTTKTPVLIFDNENPDSITSEYYKDKITKNDMLFWCDVDDFRPVLPFNVEKLEMMMNQFYESTGHDEALLIIDTCRSILEFDLQDEKQIVDFLYPLQALGQKMNFTTLLLNHTPKYQGAVYAGNNALMAALDVMMTYKRKSSSDLTASLEIEGARMGHQDPIKLIFDPMTKRLNPLCSISMSDAIINVLTSMNEGINQKTLLELADQIFVSAGGHSSKNRWLEALKNMVDNSVVERVQADGKGNQFRYFLSKS